MYKIRKSVHRGVIMLYATFVMSLGLSVNPRSAPAEIAVPGTHARESHPLTRKRYLRQIDQQLRDLDARIGRLRIRERSLKEPSRRRLSANVQILEGKLHEAKSLRKQPALSGARWRDGKKKMDAKVIRLRKSITYVSNAFL